MTDKRDILDRIKTTVQETHPGATVILYGSYARGEERPDSDIDILVLVDKEGKLSFEEETKIAYPIYDISFEVDKLISVNIYTKVGWANHRVTPYYENVNREGIIL